MKKLSLLFFSLMLLSGYGSIGQAQTTVTIGGVEYQADTLAHYKAGPGSYYTAMYYHTSTLKLRTYFLEVDATNPYISFEAVHGQDSLITCEGITSMAKRKSKEGKVYFGGTNADFFVTSGDVGYPIHGSIVESQMGRTPNNTPHIAFMGNEVLIDNILLAKSSCTIAGQNYPLDGINIARDQDRLILYNTLHGKYTRTNNYGVEVLVELLPDTEWAINKEVRVKVVKVVDGKGNMFIQPLHAVLSGHGKSADILRKLSVGEELKVLVGVDKTGGNASMITAMVGGDRIMLKDGIVQENDWNELHPRTGIGYSADGKKIYFCVVDGRSSLSNGVRTKQLADIMKSAGAATALNLDGGGSSGMYIEKFGLMNSPSDGKERAVSNGIFAVNLAATDNTIAEILPLEKNVSLPKFGSYTPVIYGYNQYGTLINLNVDGVSLSCESGVGTVKSDGSFFADGSKNGVLKIKYNQLETAINIKYLEGDSISLRLDSVIIDGYSGYPIELNAHIGNKKYPLAPYALNWTVEDPAICSVNEGTATGLKEGVTLVHGTLGELKCTLKIIVQKPNDRILSLLPLLNKGWEIKASSNIKNAELLGDGIKYTYSSGRSPYIELVNPFDLYSLPDAIRFVINPGTAAINKVVFTGKENLAIANAIFEYATELVKEKDTEILLPMKQWFSKEKEHAMYPIHFGSLKFPLVASGNVAGENTIRIKNMELVYDQVTVGISSLKMLSSLVVYPNPVKDGRAYIALKTDDIQIVDASIVNSEGQLLKVVSGDSCSGQLMELPVGELTSGLYLVKVRMGNGDCETLKLIIK